MDYTTVNKIEKARKYADERGRIVFSDFSVTIQGDHGTHSVSYHKAEWNCDCDYFAHHGFCSHTMTMQRLLGVMLPPEWREDMAPAV